MLTVRTMLAVILENELKMDDHIGFKMGTIEKNIELEVLATKVEKSEDSELKEYYFLLADTSGE